MSRGYEERVLPLKTCEQMLRQDPCVVEIVLQGLVNNTYNVDR